MESPQPPGNSFENWLLFQNIIARNYLHHREVISALKDWGNQYGRHGMRILELGCGDGYVAKNAFQMFHDIQYYGIDLSGHALNVARNNFDPLQWSTELLEGDMTKMIQQLHGPFDLVLAGFSFHHLSEDLQGNTLDQIRLILNPIGTLIVYDLMPRRGERKDAYIERLVDDVSHNWEFLEPSQVESFTTHLRNTTAPMDQPKWQAKASMSSLGNAELIYRDDAEHVGMLRM